MKNHKFEYFLTRIVATLAKSVSLKIAHGFGTFIGDLFYFIIRTRKQVALKNLSQVFGSEKNDKELHRILRGNYQHFGKTLMEFARIPLFKREEILQHIKIINREYIDEIISRQKGVLILSGHFGNWEYLAAALANIGPPLYVVFKQQKNLAVDNIIKQNRMGIGLVPLKVGEGAGKGVVSAVKENGMSIINFDQDAGKKGAFIDFLGKPASTSMGPAAIAIKNRIPVIMAISVRGKDGLIQVFMHRFTDINKFPDDEQGMVQFITEYNTILEKYIRKYPEQWFWLHRRWKSRPPE